MTQGINDAVSAGDSGQVLEVLDPGIPVYGSSPHAARSRSPSTG